MILGTYPEVLQTDVPAQTCTWMFVAALFITFKTRKLPRCPSRAKRISELWFILTMGSILVALKRNELSKRQKTLTRIFLSERSQSESYILYVSNDVTFWKRQDSGDRKRIGGCQGLGGNE